MSLTQGASAKRALIDLLTTLTGLGGPLEGVGVAYAYKKDLGLVSPAGTIDSIYGGGYRFTHEDLVAENRQRPGLLVSDVAEVSLYIRVTARPMTSVEATDERAEGIGTAIATALADNAHVAGDAKSVVSIVGGACDYDVDDGSCTSILAVNVRFETSLGY